MSERCIFCRIATGEIPAAIVCEDGKMLAFMDTGPVIKGHVLIIPKSHYNRATDVPDELLVHLFKWAKRVAQAQISGLGADGVNLIQNNGAAAGQEIPHLHTHVIPRFEQDGHRWNWNIKRYSDFKEMDDFAGKLKESITS